MLVYADVHAHRGFPGANYVTESELSTRACVPWFTLFGSSVCEKFPIPVDRHNDTILSSWPQSLSRDERELNT